MAEQSSSERRYETFDDDASRAAVADVEEQQSLVWLRDMVPLRSSHADSSERRLQLIFLNQPECHSGCVMTTPEWHLHTPEIDL